MPARAPRIVLLVVVTLLTAARYVVTKGTIPSLAVFFCVRADGLEAKLTTERDLSITVFG